MPKIRFLITAGPTAEDLDPVRFLTNRATGKLGFAVAQAVLKAGHAAVLIHGPVADSLITGLPRSSRLKRFSVRSTAEMFAAVMAAEPQADVVVMTAAPADFTPAGFRTCKIKKSKFGLTLRLKPTPDILKELGRKKRRRACSRPLTLIGFALETGSGTSAAARKKSRLQEAFRKLEDKNLDAVVLDSPAAMGAQNAEFAVITRVDRRPTVGRWSKRILAEKLVGLGCALHPSAACR
jgi:phosphopantothenoylcysteine decarboxylase/phosphopantothenate--cysteine ligase